MSVAVGVVKLTATHAPLFDVAVLLVGQVVPKDGGVTSVKQALLTVIVNEQVAVLPLMSVAVKTTVEVPMRNVAPEE